MMIAVGTTDDGKGEHLRTERECNDYLRVQKAAAGPYLFDRWLWKEKVPTPLGKFSVELQMLGDEDTNPPDEEMLRRASELVSYAESHGDYILDIVFGYYLLACESEWIDMADVPRGLTRETVSSQVRKDRSLVVSRHLE